MAAQSEVSRDYADKMLLSALEGAHASVRFYDTKAQIVGVGYILALNVVLHFGDLLPNHAPIGPLFFAAVWLIVIMPIVQFGQVLYPSRPRADRELVAKTSGYSGHPHVYHVDPDRFANVGEFVEQALKSDWTSVARCRASQDVSRQEHQAGALPSRPDDDHRFLPGARGRAALPKPCRRRMRSARRRRPARTANNRPDRCRPQPEGTCDMNARVQPARRAHETPSSL